MLVVYLLISAVQAVKIDESLDERLFFSSHKITVVVTVKSVNISFVKKTSLIG